MFWISISVALFLFAVALPFMQYSRYYDKED